MIHLIYIGNAASFLNMVLAIANGNYHAALGWFAALIFGLALAARFGEDG